ncbi:hypothetical protein BABA_12385 [Neobacillus bataviensis LMG 21833]|uniref:BD-FAE-like domain-containing protein n=1 Tax=Neobacillus bataviensis LMG 21833 TaxID=1117379 RepID=K6D7E0_9BACI|nr:alpha/beta hydrolase [Neobacillus bataviensis]EKN68442.1 hypothetical protein BABA_12385 [Neobacillus bataviensis LMG 21833]
MKHSIAGSYHRIAYGEQEDQFGDLRVPEGIGPFPVAIVIHGGFWREKLKLDQMDQFSEALTAQGIATWNIEYRRVGQEGGGWPGTFLDTSQATDFLQTIKESYPIDLNRVVTIGHSAGGHLALWLAGRHRLPQTSILRKNDRPLGLKGAISLAGVCDLKLMYEVHQLRELVSGKNENPTRDLIGGSPSDFQSRYTEGSPIALLPIGIPMTLIHGSLDINVPVGITEEFEKAAKVAGDDITVHLISSSEHFKIVNPETTEWHAVLNETLKLLN